MKISISTMTGKLKDIPAINTNPIGNKFCDKMSKDPNSICAHCYSRRMLLTYRSNCGDAWGKNQEALSKNILTKEEIPFVNNSFFRYHGHGELVNEKHFINFILIAKHNPHCTFALWTKRKDIIKKQSENIPKNLILIYSEPKMNKTHNYVPKHFDKVFSVFDKTYVKQNNIVTNCDGVDCRKCLKCYKKKSTNIISEVLR